MSLLTFLLDAIALIGFFTTLWGLVTSNAIPNWAAVVITFFSLFSIPLRVACRILGGLFSSIVRYCFAVGIPLLSLLALAIRYGYYLPGGWPVMLILLDLLFLQLIGIWLMVWGAFTPPDGLFWNILPLLGIFVFVLRLVFEGFVSPELGAGFMVVLALLYGVLNILKPREHQRVRRIWHTVLPLTAVLLLLLTGEREYASFIAAVILLYIVFYFALR